MLSFTPSEEQKMLIDAVAKVATNDLREASHEADEHSHIPENIISKAWELGILPAGIPEQYGGFGEYSSLTSALASEELAVGDLSIALAAMAPNLIALPLLVSGTEDQKKNLLPAVADAEPPMYTAALNEPGIAFDAFAPKTTAKREGDCYTINGVKCYVPMAKNAKVILVYARDTETGKVDGYLVNGGAAGLEVQSREKLMGVRALPTYQIQLNDVKVETSAKLGGEAGSRFNRLISHARLGLATMAVGVARSAFEYARDYAKERVQFKVPIATKQSIAFLLAQMAIEVDAARMLVWEAAWKLDTHPEADLSMETRLAKDYASNAAMFVGDSAVQVLGGHGYIREHPVERMLRNARGFASFDGLAML
jgi:acyl-CoA dehydrogenase